MRHERAIAGQFLFDDGLDIDRRGRAIADAGQCIERGEIGDAAGLHVAGAAAIHPAIADDRIERRMRPHVERSRRHDIDMALQDERAAGLAARAMNADDDRCGGMFGRERTAAGMGKDLAAIHGKDIDGKPSRPHLARHQILRGVLMPARRRAAHEIGGQRNLSLKAIIDRLLDAHAKILVHDPLP